MTMQMFDLATADSAVRFSPYCWRIKMALAHKGLVAEMLPVRFMDKPKIAFSGQKLVPILRDGENVIHDSWQIAQYLDASYPDSPKLFGGAQSRALANFVRHWTQTRINTTMLRMTIADIHEIIDAGDRDYFRQSREARLTCPSTKSASVLKKVARY